MRLPEYKPGGVQGLGREDINQPMRIANTKASSAGALTRALTSLALNGSDIGATWFKAETDKEAQTATATFNANHNDLMTYIETTKDITVADAKALGMQIPKAYANAPPGEFIPMLEVQQ